MLLRLRRELLPAAAAGTLRALIRPRLFVMQAKIVDANPCCIADYFDARYVDLVRRMPIWMHQHQFGDATAIYMNE